ncbi:neprilysin-4 [Stomoxys calcitrans]|uniref:neprilysin-4 n=1 Tax=Stomoxys calcitrans TaxID=35570 RepID=UPI0027E21D4C|nr:neprilysin-4 [Stomoxys calcitrans]
MRLKNINYSANVLSAIVVIFQVLLPTAWTLPTNAEFESPYGEEMLKRSKAAEIKSFMDISHDPCHDFYNFACGKWPRINAAQLFGDYSTDRFHELSKGLKRKIHKLLTDKKNGSEIEDKLKDFYVSCLKAHYNETHYLEALRAAYRQFGEFSYFKQKEGGNATTTTATPLAFEWPKVVAQILKVYGKSMILSVDVLEDFKNTNRTMVYLGTPTFDLTQMAVNIMHRLQEVKIYANLNKYLGIPLESAKKISKDLMAFEKSLSEGATDMREGKTMNELLTLSSVNDLKEEYRELFNVREFLEEALNTTQLPEQIYVYDKSYFDNLLQVLPATPAHVVEDYVLWLFVDEYFLNGKEEQPQKWCTDKSKKYFGRFIDHAIYQQYRSLDYEKEVYDLWQEIKAVFRDYLSGDRYHWISNATREHALKKLENMNLTINSYENENFDSYFKQLKIDASSYVANIQAVLRRNEALRVNKLEKHPHGIEDDQVLSFTPAYNTFSNSIKIPVAVLQPYRVWHPLYPRAIKYATLGFLLAHEMIHGFDDEGRNYDAHGNTHNWWDEKSTYEFESRRRCFQAQYHNYTYAGNLLPDSISQTENIADNAAVKIAYAAYLRWLEQEKQKNYDIEKSESFATLDYNNRELFFLSYAQLWCEDVQTLFKSLLALNDIHAPSMYRVIGSLANFHDFSWIFKCDMDAERPMNPSVKCELY